MNLHSIAWGDSLPQVPDEYGQTEDYPIDRGSLSLIYSLVGKIEYAVAVDSHDYVVLDSSSKLTKSILLV